MVGRLLVGRRRHGAHHRDRALRQHFVEIVTKVFSPLPQEIARADRRRITVAKA